MDIRIPESMNQHIHGAQGAAWRARLPELLDTCCSRWELTPEPPFDAEHVWMKVNYIAPARRGDEHVILKVMQSARTFCRERDSLRLCGESAVRLLDADEELQVLMLEHLRPGLPLAEVMDDDEATRIAAGVMRDYWQPAPVEHGLPTVEERMQGFQRLRERFDGGTGPIPELWVCRAEEAFAQLQATSPPPTVIHGDFHHWNILRAERKPWLVIDPQGLVGDPGYEFGTLLGNRSTIGEPPMALRDVYDRRTRILSQELSIPRERILTWAWVHAVLYMWVSFKDGDEWEPHIARAETLRSLV